MNPSDRLTQLPLLPLIYNPRRIPITPSPYLESMKASRHSVYSDSGISSSSTFRALPPAAPPKKDPIETGSMRSHMTCRSNSTFRSGELSGEFVNYDTLKSPLTVGHCSYDFPTIPLLLPYFRPLISVLSSTSNLPQSTYQLSHSLPSISVDVQAVRVQARLRPASAGSADQ